MSVVMKQQTFHLRNGVNLFKKEWKRERFDMF
jgi:hypothetical protein